jgi:hypothetical protein
VSFTKEFMMDMAFLLMPVSAARTHAHTAHGDVTCTKPRARYTRRRRTRVHLLQHLVDVAGEGLNSALTALAIAGLRG